MAFLILTALLLSFHCFISGFANAAEVRGDLHFPLESRAENKDGSLPIYKNPDVSIEERIRDLLPRMTLEEKTAQIIQGDLDGWMNFTDPKDNTLIHNQTGLVEMVRLKGGSFWAGYSTPWEKFVYAVTVGQRYIMENTTLGIPALVQSEGLHGFTNNGSRFSHRGLFPFDVFFPSDKGTIWPSPIGLAASFNTTMLAEAAATIADEAEGLGISLAFAPVLDLARELRWGRVEEGYGEDPFLAGEMGHAFLTGLQTGRRRNTSNTAVARLGGMCKHFAAFGSPQGGLNLAPVSGGERDLRTLYLKPFHRACLEAMSIMSAYSSYDGVPATANSHLLTDILRKEWGYKYFVTDDAGSIDLLVSLHQTCETRECAAKTGLENGLSGEMGGGTYVYLTLPDEIRKGNIDVKALDTTVTYMLRTKFSLGLFENPYPYSDYIKTLRTEDTKAKLHSAERESIVLLENRNSILPLSKSIASIALVGPQVDRVSFGDYVFMGATENGITPLVGFKQLLSNTSVKIHHAEGCKLWSNDESGFPAAIAAAESSDVAVVMVGTWSLDQTNLWTPGTNASTGEHVDVSDLGLIGVQSSLIKAIKATGKPTIVVLVSGKPVAEPWIQANADAVVQQFYPGELGGLALAEVIFGDVNPSGKLPVSFPRDVGTTPIFYNYLKGARPASDPGQIYENETLHFGHTYVLDSPLPLWSFGHGMSYTQFNYTDLTLSKTTIGKSEDFSVQVTVHNTGAIRGKEVVQVYMTDVLSSVVTPVQELIGFTKVDLRPGTSETVKISVSSSQLAVWSVQNTWVVEAGRFEIKVGTSDKVFLRTNLTVL